jgi:NTP pyrophosphatase (non-canonical NTP hydrolase)
MNIISQIAYDWAVRCFGYEHVNNATIRSLRLAEEAVELAQALEVPKEKMLLLVETVYSRERGSWQQELGGVLLTAVVLAASKQYDIDELLGQELRRVLDKPTAEFMDRNKQKLKLGLRA